MNSFDNNDNFLGRDDDSTEIHSKEVFKGKNALDILHKNIIKENEKNLNLKISDMYGVDYDEADEIHINYHSLRLRKIIEKSEILSGMKSFIENHFDIKTLSMKVATGEITENTCIDILINIMKNQKENKIKDRYINFYN